MMWDTVYISPAYVSKGVKEDNAQDTLLWQPSLLLCDVLECWLSLCVILLWLRARGIGRHV